MLTALTLLILASHADGMATVTLRVDGKPTAIIAASAYLDVPPDWTLRGTDTPVAWRNVTIVSDAGRTLVWLAGSVVAPCDAIMLIFDAPSPGCVRFAIATGNCVPSSITDAAYADVTGERINSCEVACLGDRDGDGDVDLDDLGDAIVAYGCTATLDDVTRVLSRFGMSCP